MARLAGMQCWWRAQSVEMRLESTFWLSKDVRKLQYWLSQGFFSFVANGKLSLVSSFGRLFWLEFWLRKPHWLRAFYCTSTLFMPTQNPHLAHPISTFANGCTW
jgi:hypothetical protein